MRRKHSQTRIDGDVAYVTLTKGYVATIDVADIDVIGDRAWCAFENKHGQVYAVRVVRRDGVSHSILLHRALLGEPDSLVDHRNGDSLNNRRSNLRCASNTQNQWNSKKPCTNTSGVKGVCWRGDKKVWHAKISENGKTKHLGYYDDIDAAKAAYVSAASLSRGQFANFG